MRLYILTFALIAIVIVEAGHTFFGTNVQRPLVYHNDAKYSPKVFQKRIEYINYMLPSQPSNVPRVIQGIMAYDATHTGASANVTEGGIGYNFVKLRMKSDRGRELHYDIFIYA